MPDDLGKPTIFEDVQIRHLANWLLSATKRKAFFIIRAERQEKLGHLKLKNEDARWLKNQALLHSGCMLGGEPTRQMWVQRVEKAFTELLDPEALRLARLVGGNSATLATYNCVASDLALWQLLEKQAPDLLPLIGRSCKRNFIPFDANVFRSLKQGLMEYGLREAGWKTLCRMSIKQIRWLTENLTLEQCVTVANHYAAAGVIPEDELLMNSFAFSNLLGLNRFADRPMQLALAWFDAAASRELARLKLANDPLAQYFMDNEYHVAVDWLRAYAAHGGAPDTHQKKAGWKWIDRQSEAWHAAWLEDQARQQTATNHKWRSAIAAYRDSDYEVVPLLSSVDLAIEGAKMHHCVAIYDAYCHEGRSRIFSIRREGKRVATAELVFNGRSWRLNQNRGPCNRPPDAETMAVARRLQERYNAVTKKP